MKNNMKTFQFNDGGREAAGYKGKAGDCVTRAIAIAADLPYQEVYNRLAQENFNQRKGKSKGSNIGVKTASKGINVKRKWFKDYMKELGFEWIPTMKVGEGCKVHLRAEELPKGRLVVQVSKHFCAVIDGVINDTYNPQRGEPAKTIEVGGRVILSAPATPERCVYGYYKYTK